MAGSPGLATRWRARRRRLCQRRARPDRLLRPPGPGSVRVLRKDQDGDDGGASPRAGCPGRAGAGRRGADDPRPSPGRVRIPPTSPRGRGADGRARARRRGPLITPQAEGGLGRRPRPAPRAGAVQAAASTREAPCGSPSAGRGAGQRRSRRIAEVPLQRRDRVPVVSVRGAPWGSGFSWCHLSGSSVMSQGFGDCQSLRAFAN